MRPSTQPPTNGKEGNQATTMAKPSYFDALLSFVQWRTYSATEHPWHGPGRRPDYDLELDFRTYLNEYGAAWLATVRGLEISVRSWIATRHSPSTQNKTLITLGYNVSLLIKNVKTFEIRCQKLLKALSRLGEALETLLKSLGHLRSLSDTAPGTTQFLLDNRHRDPQTPRYKVAGRALHETLDRSRQYHGCIGQHMLRALKRMIALQEAVKRLSSMARVIMEDSTTLNRLADTADDGDDADCLDCLGQIQGIQDLVIDALSGEVMPEVKTGVDALQRELVIHQKQRDPQLCVSEIERSVMESEALAAWTKNAVQRLMNWVTILADIEAQYCQKRWQHQESQKEPVFF
ncbi:hypothetical protein VTI74DRAFT_4735 [Chaetomium olivicolor]